MRVMPFHVIEDDTIEEQIPRIWLRERVSRPARTSQDGTISPR